jgi:hypothetical protein
MHRNGILKCALAGAVASAAFATPAAAADFSFVVEAGRPAKVKVADTLNLLKLELWRDGAAALTTTGDTLLATPLLAGDTVVASYGDGSGDDVEFLERATYDGLPSIATVCAGATSFAVTTAPGAVSGVAGATVAAPGAWTDVPATWAVGTPAAVLPAPVAAGSLVYAVTEGQVDDDRIRSSRSVAVKDCAPPTPPTAPVAPTRVAPVAPQVSLTVTPAQLQQAVKASVGLAGASLKARSARSLARAKTVAVPFAFVEAGSVTLELRVKGKVLGTATRTQAVNGRATLTVPLGAAARKRIKRGATLNVRAVFTPARDAAAPQAAAVNVKLRR